MRLPVFVCALCLCLDAGAVEVVETTEPGHKEGRDRASLFPDALDRIQVTATRQTKPSFEVPVAITVIDAEDVRRRVALTIADYLRGQTGSFVQSTTPGQAIPIVRGLKGSEVLHVVDGFRLNTAFFRNSPNQYFSLVDAQNVDHIELARGASSTLYGSDAMGGVVQVLTPEQRFRGEDWRGRGRYLARYASGDLGRVGRIEGAAGRDGLSISGGVTDQRVGERRLGGGQRLPFTDFDSHAADAKLLWSPASGHELMLSGQYLEQPSTPRVDELVAGFGQTTPNSSEFYFEPNDRRFAQLRYTVEPAGAWLDRAEFHAGYQEINDDRRTREYESAAREFERNRDRLRGVIATFEKRSAAHVLMFGAEAYFDTVDSVRRRLDLDTDVETVRAPRFPDGSTMNSIAAFASDTITLAPRWQINLGARYSRFEIELPPSASGIGVSLTPDDLTGNAGLTFRAMDDIHLVANLGRGFRAPNIFDLGVFGDRPSNRFAIPNPDLKPETVVTLDAGIKFERRGWQGEMFFWCSRYADKITSVDTGERLPNDRIVVQNRNVNKLSLWGLESGLRWRGEVGEVYGAINATRGDEDYAGDRYAADRIPPFSGRFGVIYRIAPQVHVEGTALFAARQYRLSPRDLADPRIDPAGTSGWGTLNVSLDWEFAADARVGVALDNLADRRYREHGSGADEVGRSLVLTLEQRF